MAEKSIELDSVEIAAAVFGNCDRNIRMLEKEFSVTAVCRGTMLRISGEQQHKCGITGLYSLRRSFYNLFGRMIATHCVNDNAHIISHSLFDD